MADRNNDRDYDRGYNRGRNFDRDYDYDDDDELDTSYNRGMNYRNRDFDRDWDRMNNQRNFNRGYNQNRGTNRMSSNRGYNRSPYDYRRGNYDYRQPNFDRDFDYTDEFDTDMENPVWTYTEYWWFVPGPYQGVGPTNYTRSDDRIRDDINERLSRHGQLDARNINIDVTNGEVTLTGNVPSRREKRLAEDIADSVFGVTDVHNQLRVSQHQGQQRGQMRGQMAGQMQGGQTKQIGCGQIHVGMEIVGSQGKHVGNVKEIHDNDFLVDRRMSKDILIPFNACKSTDDDKIHLNVAADDVDKQGWPTAMSAQTKGK